MKVEFIHGRLSSRSRFIIAIFFYALAAILQALLVKGVSLPTAILRFAGFVLLLIPLRFLKARNFTNKPEPEKVSKPSASGTWRNVSISELDRLRSRIGDLRKIAVPAIYKVPIAALVTFFMFFAFVPAIAVAGIAGLFSILDLYLILFPFLWFARIEKWYPEVSGVLDVFAPLLEAELPGRLVISPMLFFRGGEAAAMDQYPSDLRLMLGPGPEAPKEIKDELLGAQFQMTHNKGPNGLVPYAYAVFITKGKGKIWQFLKTVRAPGFVTEPGSSEENGQIYGTVVVRLDTKSRSDGYHTKEGDVLNLLEIATRALEKAW